MLRLPKRLLDAVMHTKVSLIKEIGIVWLTGLSPQIVQTSVSARFSQSTQRKDGF